MVISIVAATVKTRWVQIACPILLTAMWVYYLVDLQGALK